MFEFTIVHKDNKSKARTGKFITPHGDLETPSYAFVATEGEIKSIPDNILSKLPISYMIVNTFHIWVKDFLQKIQEKKGIHTYAKYKNICASDSGGFQVFSMGFGKTHNMGKIGGMFPGKNYKTDDTNNPLVISEKGVEFIFNEKKILLTPEKSMEIQQRIGADIIFAFDECTSPLNSKEYTKKAMERTHRWVQRCIKTKKSKNQALFAIVQGGYFKDLRKISSQYMAKLDVPGYGIGGSLGTTENEVRDVLDWTIPYLPEEKPRHLLGIGTVKDIFDCVERGVDLFDCVIPTREARHKVLYTKRGKVQLRKMKNSNESIDWSCQCITCKEKVTWKHLNKLFSQKNPQAFFYATVHNIQFFSDLMKEIRYSIGKQTLNELKNTYFLHYEQ